VSKLGSSTGDDSFRPAGDAATDAGTNRTGQQAQEVPAQKIHNLQKAFSMVGFDQSLFSSFDSYFIC